MASMNDSSHASKASPSAAQQDQVDATSVDATSKVMNGDHDSLSLEDTEHTSSMRESTSESNMVEGAEEEVENQVASNSNHEGSTTNKDIGTSCSQSREPNNFNAKDMIFASTRSQPESNASHSKRAAGEVCWAPLESDEEREFRKTEETKEVVRRLEAIGTIGGSQRCVSEEEESDADWVAAGYHKKPAAAACAHRGHARAACPPPPAATQSRTGRAERFAQKQNDLNDLYTHVENSKAAHAASTTAGLGSDQRYASRPGDDFPSTSAISRSRSAGEPVATRGGTTRLAPPTGLKGGRAQSSDLETYGRDVSSNNPRAEAGAYQVNPMGVFRSSARTASDDRSSLRQSIRSVDPSVIDIRSIDDQEMDPEQGTVASLAFDSLPGNENDAGLASAEPVEAETVSHHLIYM